MWNVPYATKVCTKGELESVLHLPGLPFSITELDILDHGSIDSMVAPRVYISYIGVGLEPPNDLTRGMSYKRRPLVGLLFII